MRLSNYCFCLGLFVLLLASTELAGQEIVTIPEKSQTRIGFALPTCSAKSKTTGTVGKCDGFRIDYINTWDVVFALESIELSVPNSFVEHYALGSILVGYRFDFDTWIHLFGGNTIPVLSSLYLTLVPLFADTLGGEVIHVETIKTKDYKIIYGVGPPLRLELGWKINNNWDVFVYGHRSKLGPFLVKTENGVVKDYLTVTSVFFGAHYTF